MHRGATPWLSVCAPLTWHVLCVPSLPYTCAAFAVGLLPPSYGFVASCSRVVASGLVAVRSRVVTNTTSPILSSIFLFLLFGGRRTRLHLHRVGAEGRRSRCFASLTTCGAPLLSRVTKSDARPGIRFGHQSLDSLSGTVVLRAPHSPLNVGKVRNG